MGAGMEWLVLAFVFVVLCGLVVYTLMRMAGEADRKARHAQRRIDPFCEITISRFP